MTPTVRWNEGHAVLLDFNSRKRFPGKGQVMWGNTASKIGEAIRDLCDVPMAKYQAIESREPIKPLNAATDLEVFFNCLPG